MNYFGSSGNIKHPPKKELHHNPNNDNDDDNDHCLERFQNPLNEIQEYVLDDKTNSNNNNVSLHMIPSHRTCLTTAHDTKTIVTTETGLPQRVFLIRRQWCALLGPLMIVMLSVTFNRNYLVSQSNMQLGSSSSDPVHFKDESTIIISSKEYEYKHQNNSPNSILGSAVIHEMPIPIRFNSNQTRDAIKLKIKKAESATATEKPPVDSINSKTNSNSRTEGDDDYHDDQRKDRLKDDVIAVNSKSDSTTRHPPPSPPPPRIAWLMSFPNSGTTYTLKFIQGSTQTTTATNYGYHEQVGYSTSIGFVESHNNNGGPFLRYPNRMVPTNYILTKTHCEPQHLQINATEFAVSCRSGNAKVNGILVSPITYNASLVHKAIHLMRNPFDNIVARMHYARKSWKQGNNVDNHHGNNHDDQQTKLTIFTDDKIGFQKWCSYTDRANQKHGKLGHIIHQLQPSTDYWVSLLKQNGKIPSCITEFYRYLNWHNMAVEVTMNVLQLPTMHLYYENYTSTTPTTSNPTTKRMRTRSLSSLDTQAKISSSSKGYDRGYSTASQISRSDTYKEGTISPAGMELLSFLEFQIPQDIVGTPPEFVEGKSYDYFDVQDQQIMAQLAKSFLSPSAWKLLEHYFVHLLDNNFTNYTDNVNT